MPTPRCRVAARAVRCLLAGRHRVTSTARASTQYPGCPARAAISSGVAP
jgi:hypothetical protein